MEVHNKMTHEEFIECLFERNENFRKGEIGVINKYTKSTDKILVKNKYGACSVKANSLFFSSPTMRSAIDRTSYFINQAKEVHGNKYDYSDVIYTKASVKVKIRCINHGYSFLQTPNAHLRGSGCHKCGDESSSKKQTWSTNAFTKKAIEIHGDKYDYSETVYKGANNKLKILCKKHGYFNQKASKHLLKNGCPTCSLEQMSENPTGWRPLDWKEAANNSKYFDSFKVYIIKCWSENEEFYKIGRTYRKVSVRFECKKYLPYNYEVVNIIKGSAEEMFDLENKLKGIHKSFKYTPKIEFGGMTECFSEILLEEVRKYVDN